MKKTLSIIVGLILLSPLAFAANVTLTTDITIKVGSYNLTLTSQRGVDSIVVGSSSFDVSIPANNSFMVVSADRRAFAVTPTTGVTVTNGCDSSRSTVGISTAGLAETVTITPSTSATCSSSGGGSDSGSGIVGGGSGSLASYNYGSTPAASVTPTAAPAAPVATSVAPSVAQPSAVAQVASPVFNKDLALGNRSDDVKRLQQLLGTDKDIYPEGQASGFYGALTQKAVRAFQKKYGLPQVGNVGPATRAKLASVFGSSAAQPESEAATITRLEAVIADLTRQIQVLLAKRALLNK